jgi:hypothetical protein
MTTSSAVPVRARSGVRPIPGGQHNVMSRFAVEVLGLTEISWVDPPFVVAEPEVENCIPFTDEVEAVEP